MLDKLAQDLLAAQNECTLSWITQDGSPAATVVSFLFAEGALWLTAERHAARIRAIRRNPRVAIVVSGSGSKMGHTRCVSLRGRCEILADAKTRDWFFPLFSRRVLNKSRIGASMMAKSMNNETNLVIRFVPEKAISYDAQKAMKLANFMP